MPEQITKYPEVTIKVLKGRELAAGKGRNKKS